MSEPVTPVEGNTEEAVLVKGKEERGASMVEYGLLVALIAVVAIAAVRLLGQAVSTNFSTVTSSIAVAG